MTEILPIWRKTLINQPIITNDMQQNVSEIIDVIESVASCPSVNTP